MLRKGFIGAAVAALALASAAFADDSMKAASKVGTEAQINSNTPAEVASPAINPVYGDDQIPAAPAARHIAAFSAVIPPMASTGAATERQTSSSRASPCGGP